MPLPHEIHPELAPYYEADYTEQQAHRLAALPEEIAHIGRALTGIDAPDPRYGALGAWLQKHTIMPALRTLPPADRQRLFTALYPTIADEAEAGWQLFDRLPYQYGSKRQQFRFHSTRMPTDETAALVYGRRSSWVSDLILAARGYNQPITWFAERAAYLGQTATLGILFAGAIERGGPAGQDVFNILDATAAGAHPIGRMSGHVPDALMLAYRPDGWTIVERLLLETQAIGSIRETILGDAAEGHPGAFKRLLGAVVDNDLLRYEEVLKSARDWLGAPFDDAPPKAVAGALATARRFLEDPAARQAALDACRLADGTGRSRAPTASAQAGYLALWSLAVEDVLAAVAEARPLLVSPVTEYRFIAAHLLGQTRLKTSLPVLAEALADKDVGVALCALSAIDCDCQNADELEQAGVLRQLETLARRLPQGREKLPALVWDWVPWKAERFAVQSLANDAYKKYPEKYWRLWFLTAAPPEQVEIAASLLKETSGQLDEGADKRAAVLELLGEIDSYFQPSLLGVLARTGLRAVEAPLLEAFLARAGSRVRSPVVKALLTLEDAPLLESIDRLLAGRRPVLRLAGLELLRDMARAGRQADACRARAALVAGGTLTAAERPVLADLLEQEDKTYSLADALGLADLSKVIRPLTPRPPGEAGLRLGSPAEAACLQSLEALIEQYAMIMVETGPRNNRRTCPLCEVRDGFNDGPDPALSIEENLARLPLIKIWERWYQSRPPALRDADGLELVRARAALALYQHLRADAGDWHTVIPTELRDELGQPYPAELRWVKLPDSILRWLEYMHPTPGAPGFLLDALEAQCHRLGPDPIDRLHQITIKHLSIRERIGLRLPYLALARWSQRFQPQSWQAHHHTRLVGLILWLDEYTRPLRAPTLELNDLVLAHKGGGACDDDLLLFFLAKPEVSEPYPNFYSLYNASGVNPEWVNQDSITIPRDSVVQAVIERCRERILTVEEQRRGALPNPASIPARTLQSMPGMRYLLRLLADLGPADFDRRDPSSTSHPDHIQILSRLVRVCYPLDGDTPEAFTAQVRAAGISEKRLVDTAVFSPLWARFIEHALGWPGLAEAVWWLHAHTKSDQYHLCWGLSKLWKAQMHTRTAFTLDQLREGAVDVDWFRRFIGRLGEERWQAVYDAALYATSGISHARVRLYADALLNRVSSDELIERIQTKRNTDALRALGLLPLPDGERRQAELLRRYQVVQTFLRQSKQQKSKRQDVEKLAGSLALEYLARTAGFPDPQRLEWAMELDAVADLANGSVSVETDGVTLSLSVDYLGEAQLNVSRGARPLKSIPPAVKKDPMIQALVQRKKTLEEQARHMRQSLETAMIRGDDFTAAEIRALFRHPVLRVLLEQLVFISPEAEGQRVAGQDAGAPTMMGYPVEGGSALEGFDGQRIGLTGEEKLRLAHPHDLLRCGEWHRWQRECFISERIQPFKQNFRELYVLTPNEKNEFHTSLRYRGHHVVSNRALALLGGRGWVAQHYEMYKTFLAEDITANTILIGFEEFGGVWFTKRHDRVGNIPLEQVPPRLFSEVMRDLDLVVSVAHAGGVDPEASASTVEARAALVQETCALLRLANVRVENHHALVDGRLGNYTIHLGSAVVHKQPGGSLCIVPVHAQHRGRLFLPFVDNDPKTAEVVSKVILLAKDHEIKDPTILEQILR